MSVVVRRRNMQRADQALRPPECKATELGFKFQRKKVAVISFGAYNGCSSSLNIRAASSQHVLSHNCTTISLYSLLHSPSYK